MQTTSFDLAIGLDRADRKIDLHLIKVATGQMLRGLIAVRGDDNHRVEMRMIEAEAYIKDIIEADAGAHGFETQGLGSVERKVTLGIGVHGGAKFA